LKDWAYRHGVNLVHIQPGKPTQNAYIQRFNRTCRNEVLDRFVFTSLDDVRRMTEDWRHRYNHHRPHRFWTAWHRSPSLGHLHQPMLSQPDLCRSRWAITDCTKKEPGLRRAPCQTSRSFDQNL